MRALHTRGERERVSKRTWMVHRDERVRCANVSTPGVARIANFESRRGQRNFGHSHSGDGVEWTNGERPRGVERVRRPEAARRSFKRRGFCRSRREMRPRSVHVRGCALFRPRAVRRPDLSSDQHEVRVSNITRRDANETRRLHQRRYYYIQRLFRYSRGDRARPRSVFHGW